MTLKTKKISASSSKNICIAPAQSDMSRRHHNRKPRRALSPMPNGELILYFAHFYC